MFPGEFVETHGSKPAVIMADSGWTQTFAELDAAANQLSRVFRAAGLQPGDHVALCLENHPRYLEILWGCEYAGLIYTAISTRLTTEELAWRDDGYLLTHAPQTYKIPTSRDMPADFRVAFFENENAEDTVHRSKAIGEPPLQLAVSVWLAIWDAVASAGGHAKAPALRAPATPEAILDALESIR